MDAWTSTPLPGLLGARPGGVRGVQHGVRLNTPFARQIKLVTVLSTDC